MARIELSSVAKTFGQTQVIEEIDLAIEDGEFLVILGPSGCGKSTLLRMIAGLEDVSAGTITMDGNRIDQMPPKDRGCAMVFQNYALYPHMTVAGNIGYGLRMAGMPKVERNRRVAETAALLDLQDLLDRKPRQLSGGQRQRVAIGRALAREPKVFLFDEPLSNLDAKLRTQTRVELRKLHDRLGATTVYVTHDQVEALTLADRIAVFNKGRVEQVGRPRDIYRHPETLFVAGFVGTPQTNLLPGRVGAEGDRFELAGGTHLPLPATLGKPHAGNPATFGIRPEDIHPDEGMAEARIDLVEDLGGHRLLHCLIGGETLIVVDTGDRPRERGAPLRFTCTADRVLLFDGESGRRIAR